MLHINHAWEPHVNQDSLIKCCVLTMHRSHTSIKIPRQLHVNRAWEPHVNKDSQTECCTLTMHHIECCTLTAHRNHTLIKICSCHTVSQRESSKFHLKIPACDSQHCLQSNLSQTHSYHGVKRPNKQTNSNLWEVCFSLAAVVRKVLLGC